MGDSTKKSLTKDEITEDEFKAWTTAGLVIAVARYAAGQLKTPLATSNAQRAATELNIRIPPRSS